tara:strand:+ start:66 stop:842 length:777 start_codon:yes stop_codon:yes gene_type:complete
VSNLIDIIERNNLKIGSHTLSEDYGTEHFCFLLYSLIRMQRPKNIFELGCGYGCVSTIIGQALKENKKGKLYCVDNQADWINLKENLKKIGENYNTYDDYFNYLINKFNLKDFVEYKNFTIDFDKNNSFHIDEPIDILFYDAHDSGPKGCVQFLSFYLLKMSEYSDIFIDRASTVNYSFLMLEYIVNNLQKGKIPKILLDNKTREEINYLHYFVNKSKFTLVHLAESPENKVNQLQNSTAWIKIEPLDIIIGNNVKNY